MTDEIIITEALSPRELRRRSRYNRPRRYISWTTVILAIGIGISGGLFFAWNVSPTEEVNTAPRQLNAQDKAHYTVAALLEYNYTQDLNTLIGRLESLGYQPDPIQMVASIACDLTRTGYVNSSSGDYAVRVMMAFYQSQGRTGCADDLLPPLPQEATSVQVVQAATATLPPPPSKTPTEAPAVTETPTPESTELPTSAPQGAFSIVNLQQFCDIEYPGVIEIYVFDETGAGLAGQRVRVSWSDGESTFLTGLLRPERGPEYADFQMEAGRNYTVEMPDLSNPSNALIAEPCTDANGDESVRSYRVFFNPSVGG